MRPEAVAPGDVDILPNDLFEIGRCSGVREKVVGHAKGEIDEQVHIAVGPVLRPHDRAEHRDVDNAARTKFDFVGAELREDGRKERHEEKLLPRGMADDTPMRQLSSLEIASGHSPSTAYGEGICGASSPAIRRMTVPPNPTHSVTC